MLFFKKGGKGGGGEMNVHTHKNQTDTKVIQPFLSFHFSLI